MVSEPQTYKNVMEAFVQEEIEFQLQNNKALSRSADYINLLEVATFALNRLPCYYASSIEGIERQRRRIKEKKRVKTENIFCRIPSLCRRRKRPSQTFNSYYRRR